VRYPSRFGVFYDFRNPQRWAQPWPERYRQLMEQMSWVDADLPFDEVSLSEHHFVEDGWSPSTMALAAAAAARTRRVGIVTNIVQLPLHHPLRIAEDALTVDIVSDGRFRLGVSAGYREQEFDGLGVPIRERGSRMDEGLVILRRAFAGAPFSFDGRHWSFPELTVTPGPMRPGGPEIWIGGKARPALERAAAHGDGFLASALEDVAGYLAARRAMGHHDDPPRAARTTRMIVAEDPERALYDLGDHLLFQVNQYIDYGFIAGPHYSDPRDLLRDGVSQIVDAEGALAELRLAAEAGVDEVHLFSVVPGESVESGSQRLAYVADKVIRVASESRKPS
jgi:alkanesulfonate monooxygenase SsuD/methylene tetrahydromethanopterin reductase-like flavin-dependent oxidoreductase (luciferase family)